MDRNSRIYVAGHTGFIGSAILRELNASGYSNILTKTHRELDLTNKDKATIFFAEEKPEYVFLAAAKGGGGHANSSYPAEFIYEDLMIQTNVIDLAFKSKVKKLLFLASSCIYPKICSQPIREEYLMTGRMEAANESYGVAKLAGIKMCEAYNREYGTNFISAIPANLFGINDHFNEDGHVVASLVKKFHQAKIKGCENVPIWGTGKPKREFLYVDDLAQECLFLMEKYDKSELINVGTGEETSIAELAELIKWVVEFKGEIIYDSTKPDGNPSRLLDSTRINNLGRKSRTGLVDGLKITYQWYKNSLPG